MRGVLIKNAFYFVLNIITSLTFPNEFSFEKNDSPSKKRVNGRVNHPSKSVWVFARYILAGHSFMSVVSLHALAYRKR